MTVTSFATLLRRHADAAPDAPALTCEGVSVSRLELDRASNRLARAYAKLGVGYGDLVTIGLPNGLEFFHSALAVWKLGATPNPVSSKMPPSELAAVVELAKPALVVGMELGGHPSVPLGFTPDPDLSDDALPDVVSPVWKAVTSGGSTGRPKLIKTPQAACWEEIGGLAGLVQLSEGKSQLTTGPLSHNGPFLTGAAALLMGNNVVIMPRFDATTALALIQEHSIDWMYAVPTMMQRISRLEDEVRASFDVSSLRIVMHLAAPCPAWVKQHWIDWLGPTVVWELYAGTEAQAITLINGVQWLEHRGSVGAPVVGEIEIRHADGSSCAPEEIGEVWMRRGEGAAPTYEYIGAQAKSKEGWESLGDLGYMDSDGYLYLTDRDSDMILVGGANVYPAEIEEALTELPGVKSSAVVGLPHADLGNVPHAIVEADESVTDEEILAHLKAKLASYKLPRSVERVDYSLRDDAGKIRRSALRAERIK